MALGLLSGISKDYETVELIFECYDTSSAVSGQISLAGGLVNIGMYEDGSLGFNIGGFSTKKNKNTMKLLTFDGLTRKSEARWAQHDIIGYKPILEFIGPGLEEISFTMILNATYGVDPEEEMKKLRKMRDEGIELIFMLGDEMITENCFILQSVDEEHRFYDGQGNLLVSAVNVSLKEYAKEAEENGN